MSRYLYKKCVYASIAMAYCTGDLCSTLKSSIMKLSLSLRSIAGSLLAALFLLLSTGSQAQSSTPVKNILLVHGAFADGSGWEDIYKILSGRGYNVVIVQNPLLSLEEDVIAVNRALDRV